MVDGVPAPRLPVECTQPQGRAVLTFLPQLLSADTGSPRGEALLLSAVFAALYLAWFGLYVAVADGLGRCLDPVP
ncbi:MAG: hypothetical protein ACRDTM_10675 [Micromonosporaceae bacterium]